MKRFLSMFVTSMFLASASFAAETKEEKKAEPAKADSKAKAGDTKGATKGDAKAKTGDTKGDAKSDEKKTGK